MMKNLGPEEENVIKDVRTLFRLEKQTKSIKDRILRDIKNRFVHEEENYYKPVRVSSFGVIIILNMKVKVIKIKHYELKNI